MHSSYSFSSLHFFSFLLLLPLLIRSSFSPLLSNAIAQILYVFSDLSWEYPLCVFKYISCYEFRLFIVFQFIQVESLQYSSGDALGFALEKAAMANKTVVITVINKAYADQGVRDDTTMLDVFLSGFWLGEDTRKLLDHLLLVAVDQTAYDRCRFQRLNCFKLETEGVDFGGEKLYMSEEFIKMMWKRTLFLLEVLKRGYSFIFTVNTFSYSFSFIDFFLISE